MRGGLPPARSRHPTVRREERPPGDHQCFPLQVDGQTVRVHGDPDMSPQAREALADVIRAATELAERDAAARSPEERAHIEAVHARNRERVERLRRS